LKLILERRWRKYDTTTAEEKVVGRVGDAEILRDVQVITRRA
jgi:hypothetical protein